MSPDLHSGQSDGQLDLVTEDRSALLSPCERYRYRLDRAWGAGGRVLFVMLNPSTADATADDPTIRRCIGFAKTWACGGLTVVNLYAWRATKPAELNATPPGVPPVGEWIGGLHRNRNDDLIREAASECGMRVAAWGAWAGPVPRRPAAVMDLLLATPWEGRGRSVYALGLTKKGAPRHPLYMARAAKPIVFASQEDRGLTGAWKGRYAA